MIPQIIHRIWLGSEVPAEFDVKWDRWRECFPDFELRTWGESELRQLGMPDYMWAGRTWAEQADIARLRILNRCGGIYTDCDAEPLRRFDDLWTEADKLIVFEEAGFIWNGLIVAAPGALSFVEKYTERNAHRHAADVAPNVRTGPFPFEAALNYQAAADVSGIRGVRLYPPAFVDTTGEQTAAVVRTRFRDPPVWAEAPNDGVVARRSRMSDLVFDARLLPLRIRRAVARQR